MSNEKMIMVVDDREDYFSFIEEAFNELKCKNPLKKWGGSN